MPLMIDILDLRDLDLIGEVLRAHCFLPDANGNDLGCHSTFELRPEFKPLERTSALGAAMVNRLLGAQVHENPQEIERAQLHSDGRIHLGWHFGWHWDGDGTLLFMVDELAIINTDCKKSYGWKLEMPAGVIDVVDILHDRLSGHQRLAAMAHPRFWFLNRLLMTLAPLVTLVKFNDLRHEVCESIDDLKKTLILSDERIAQARIARKIAGDLARITAKYSAARDLPKLRQAHEALVAILAKAGEA